MGKCKTMFLEKSAPRQCKHDIETEKQKIHATIQRNDQCAVDLKYVKNC